jgi:phosphatidylinositol glycan class B
MVTNYLMRDCAHPTRYFYVPLTGNGNLYGTHPFHWYISSGIPAISGLLLPFLLIAFFCEWSYGRRNLWIIVVCYTLTHSLSAHKEFRFLLPLLPLFCVIAAQPLQHFLKDNHLRKAWLTLGVLLNLVTVLYLGLFHQRAPIDVNRAIVNLVRREPQTYSIHYLMGCHSTPLLSHLHTPPVKFETWTLDCSPDCRSNSKIECESDRFSKHPARFMEETYFRCTDLEEGICVSDNRFMYPDFLVAFAGELPSMKSQISSMGLKEVARFPQGIIGASLFGGAVRLGEISSNTYTKVSLFDLVELSLDEMVLFASKNI